MNNKEFDPEAQILVIDDDPDICALVQLTLQHEGHKVLTALTDLEGLQAFNENIDTIKLVLLDIALPGVSGVDVLEKLLKIDSSIPVIFMSAYIEDKAEASSFGAIDAITKPFDLEDLKRQVSAALTA
ncbi:MAG: response regulator [Gammaproteobacteria bacterium]|nr:response regulator [Gammaproteobacteria bacterium]